MNNTRFNPTVNGPLHLGHLYVILVNENEAERTGGKFYLRYDDTQWSWNYDMGPEAVEKYRQLMRDDLDWLGIQPIYESQVDMMPRAEELLKNIFDYHPDKEQFFAGSGTILAGCEHHFYPYTDRLTVEKVVFDAMEDIGLLIRGMDLITEDCLYKHYCAKLNIREPVTSYLPRLYTGNSMISKTLGNYKICDYRQAGIDPAIILRKLREDCLADSERGWEFYNVKANPKLGKWAMEALRGISKG